jgi:hypothetical protein
MQNVGLGNQNKMLKGVVKDIIVQRGDRPVDSYLYCTLSFFIRAQETVTALLKQQWQIYVCMHYIH